jgi:ferric-dicitrate binding protein FerR (iron transport regulator)
MRIPPSAAGHEGHGTRYIKVIEYSAYEALKQDRDALKEANDNCISLLLHECRMKGLQNEYDELKDRYEQACKSDNAHREALEKIEKTWQKYGHESAWQVLRDYGRTIKTASEE